MCLKSREGLKLGELLSTNSSSKHIRNAGKILVYASCLETERPEIVKQFKGYYPLKVCMEESIFNVVALKIASILARIELDELGILTVDGSPHCLQLHHVAEEALKITRSNCRLRHFVVVKGKIKEIPSIAVKISRYLSKVSLLLSSGDLPDSLKG